MQVQQAVYDFPDGRFQFFSAELDETGERVCVFRVRVDRNPKTRAAEKGIRGVYVLRRAAEREIAMWLESHPDRVPARLED